MVVRLVGEGIRVMSMHVLRVRVTFRDSDGLCVASRSTNGPKGPYEGHLMCLDGPKKFSLVVLGLIAVLYAITGRGT